MAWDNMPSRIEINRKADPSSLPLPRSTPHPHESAGKRTPANSSFVTLSSSSAAARSCVYSANAWGVGGLDCLRELSNLRLREPTSVSMYLHQHNPGCC